MNRVDQVFASLRPAGAKPEQGRKALMPFIVGGRPDAERLPKLLGALESAGASVVEIGIPFSDPIADGPVIAAAMHRALEQGVTPETVFESVASARGKTKLALVAMVSVSLVHHRGAKAFVERAANAGFDGFIFPDAPLEEADAYIGAARSAGCSASLLVAPATPDDRAAAIARASSGFVYLIARAGLTGEQSAAPDVQRRVQLLRQTVTLPIACGFGISTPEHVRAVVRPGEAGGADAAIVGSALVRRIEDALASGEDPIAEAHSFVSTLSCGLAKS